MKVEAIALTDFVHDQINAIEGKLIQPLIDKTLADELVRSGLVRIRMNPHAREPRPREFDDPGKAPAAGRVQPSSSSPAARVSPQTTAHSSSRGGRHGRSSAR